MMEITGAVWFCNRMGSRTLVEMRVGDKTHMVEFIKVMLPNYSDLHQVRFGDTLRVNVAGVQMAGNLMQAETFTRQ